MSCSSPVVYGKAGALHGEDVVCCACAGSHRVVMTSRMLSRRRIVFLLFAEVLRVNLRVVLPLFRQITDWENRGDWADRDAGPTINALVRVDVKLSHFLVVLQTLALRPAVVFAILRRMDAVHGTCVYARRVFGA